MYELLASESALHGPLSYLELYPYPAFILSSSTEPTFFQASSSTTPHPTDVTQVHPASSTFRPPDDGLSGEIYQTRSPLLAPSPLPIQSASHSQRYAQPRVLPILWENNIWAQEYAPLGAGGVGGNVGSAGRFEDALNSAQMTSLRAWLDRSSTGGWTNPEVKTNAELSRSVGGGVYSRTFSPTMESPELFPVGSEIGGEERDKRRRNGSLSSLAGGIKQSRSIQEEHLGAIGNLREDGPIKEDPEGFPEALLNPFAMNSVGSVEARPKLHPQSVSGTTNGLVGSVGTGPGFGGVPPSRAPTMSSHRPSVASSIGDGRAQSGGTFLNTGTHPVAGGSGTTTSHHDTTLSLLVELGHKAFSIDLVKTYYTPSGTTPGVTELPTHSWIIVQSIIKEVIPNAHGSAHGHGQGIPRLAWSRRVPARQRVMESYTVSHVSPFQDPGKKYLGQAEAVAQERAASERTRSTGTMSHRANSLSGRLGFESREAGFESRVDEEDAIPDGDSGAGGDLVEEDDIGGGRLGSVGGRSVPIRGDSTSRSRIDVHDFAQEGTSPRSDHGADLRARPPSAHSNGIRRRSGLSATSSSPASATGLAKYSGSLGASQPGPQNELETGIPTIAWLLENLDWSASPLGAKSQWPGWLHATLSLVLATPGPACLWLGQDLVMLYNEAYVSLAPLGVKSFGTRAKDSWSPELYQGLASMFDGMTADSLSRENDLWLLPLPTHFTEAETYHSFFMIKLRVNAKRVGYYNYCTDVTAAHLLTRRNKVLSDIARTTALSRTRAEFFAGIAAALNTEDGTRDVPYMAIYDVTQEDGDLETSVNELSMKATDHEISISLHLETTVGVPEEHPSIPISKRMKLSRREMRKMGLGLEAAAASKLLVHSASDAGSGSNVSQETVPLEDWPVGEAMTTGRVVYVEDASELVAGFELRIWDDLPKEAVVVPIIPKGSRLPTAIIIMGVNRRRPFDQEHRDWIENFRSNLGTSLAAVSSLELETLQKEKALALTKSMNNFFGSAAHELRAPLTLCVGPITDLAKHVQDPRGKTLLGLALRNVLRLQRLVSSLMDYSKLDAGREKIRFRLTNISDATRELVSAFQSFPTIQQGKVTLESDIENNEDAQVFVDPALWDRIVTNLCSNAVKYTPSGVVIVSLSYTDSSAILSVSDTGIGIPLRDMPYITERFYRVSGSEAIAEGSGIGLAYCNELVKIHGASLQIDSQTAAESGDGTHGSTFQVILPLGCEHLDRATVVFDDDYQPQDKYCRAIVDDAAAWQREQDIESSVGDTSDAEGSGGSSGDSKGLDPATLFFSKSEDVILIVDDNADMRQYISSLFSPLATVLVARDGLEALEIARNRLGGLSLILSDVNMPRMTGTELLAALRLEQNELAFIPVVLLTAKAGEEDQIDGLLAGADDYLAKPFKSRELIARVNVQVQIGKKRKQLERLFARRTAELEIIAKYSPIGIVRADSDGLLTYVNDAWYDQSGYSPRDVYPIGDWGPFCMPEDLPQLVSAWMGFVHDPSAKQVELVWRWKNGRVMNATFVRLNRINPYLDGFVGCVVDLTFQKLKEKEQELMIIEEKARREAAVAARQQQELLIDVTSHELRNPVSAIIQSSLVVAQDLQSLKTNIQDHLDGRTSFSPDGSTMHLIDEAIDSMDSIFQCGQSMTSISNDILALGRIQLDTLQVFPVATDLSREVPKILSIFRTETRKLQIDMELHLGAGFREIPTIQTDPVRFGQILNNLVTNAIRFTATSAIRKIAISIDVSMTAPVDLDCLLPALTLPTGLETPGTPIWVYCSVQDTGPGLAPESLQLLFKRFSQATSETHVQFGGSGLGLFVCRKLCDLLGGKIEISSQFGQGSTFRFVIKAGTSPPASVTAAAAQHAKAASEQNRRKLTVAVVEDNAINSKLLKRQLTGAGHTVAVAFNGEEGLELMREKGYMRFDVVIMDIEMPVVSCPLVAFHIKAGELIDDIAALQMDGLTAIRTIRKEEREKGVPRQQVVALTGNAREAQKQAALDAGYDDVVIKPYKLESLLQVLDKWARVTGAD